MVILRFVLFALVGAMGAAAALYAYQYALLVAKGADPGVVALETLLIDIMALPSYAGTGAALGLLLAPFVPALDRLVWGMLRWVLLGAVVGGLVPVVRLIVGLGGLPSVTELSSGYVFDSRFFLAASAGGVACAIVEGLLIMARRRRRVGRRGIHLSTGSRADEALKEFWEERADSYLSSRNVERDDRR